MLSTGLFAIILVISTVAADDGCDLASAMVCIKEEAAMGIQGDLYRLGSGSKESYCDDVFFKLCLLCDGISNTFQEKQNFQIPVSAVNAYIVCSEKNLGRCAGVDSGFKQKKAELCQSDCTCGNTGLTASLVLVGLALFLSRMTTI